MAYDRLGTGWLLFATLFLIPDVGMVGYVRSPRLGAIAYDILHTLAGPAVLGFYAVLAGAPDLLAVALIWLAHIGMDRALGYGLKYPSGFRDTHLGRIGRH
ncbi:MAG: DUF4260 domain-containing protein [Acidimicrobiia bacterium]